MKPFVEPLKQEIQEAATAYIKRQIVQPIHHQGYLSYVSTGDRRAFESEYFSRRRQLAALALAVDETADVEAIKLLSDVIWEICNEFTWAVPAHLPTKTTALFQQAVPCIDLFAAETGQALSEIKYLIGSQLDELLLQRIDFEIERRIFHPFLAQHWFWETSGNNWSAVVAGSIGMAALYQIDSGSSFQQELLEKVAHCLQNYLDSFEEDGACLEGIGYWAYGFGYYIYFAELYERLLGDDYYLTLPKVKQIASFPQKVMLTKRQFVLFSDYTESVLPTGLVTFCKERLHVAIPPVVTPNHLDDDHCYRFAHILRDVKWAKEHGGQEPTDGVTYLKDAQWLFARDAQTNCFLAAKGGSNTESHNHNDVGHFIAGIDQTIFLTDLGAGEYVKTYFQKERYDFLTTSSKGHSVPIINGCFQQAGEYQAHQVKQNKKQLQMELAEVYPKEAQLNEYLRTIDFTLSNGEINLTDSFVFTQSLNRVTENFVTLIEPKVRDNQVLMTTADRTYRLLFDTTEIEIQVVPYRNHRAETQVAYLIQASYVVGKEAQVNVQVTFDV